ncbi:MAG TPA: penicillin-binding protein 2 [Alphaproteobacteria bacterium]|nr:penicillin-binding protein 2 [Alphaproteobacteria bacterium]
MSDWRKSKRQTSSRQPSLPGLFAPRSKSRRLATPQEQALEVARGRMMAATLIFSIAYLVIAGRLAYLTLLNDAPEMPMAHQEASESITSRADITDRNGTVLATSLPTVSLCADAKKIINPDEALKQLIAVLPELDKQKVGEDLHGNKHCVMIKRHLTPKQSYEVNKLGIAGLEFRPDERRIYPAGNVAAHVVGYTDIDNNGLGGLEKEFDTKLEEQPDAVVSSLDLRVQTILHRELSIAMNNFHAIGAAGLVMDMSTGEMLGMVSLPDFDPQHPGNAEDEARFNRDTMGVYEMGSTFKIFNTALALDTGTVKPSDSFDTTHPIEIGGQTIKDFHPENRWLNVAEIFTHSSNIGSARMAERIGGARQRAFLSRLGLTEKSKIELPEVGAPLVPSARDWGQATTMTAAFGHGIAVNAVQLAGAVATIVNDGQAIRPTLLKQPNTTVASNGERVVSPHTSALLRAMMRLVVTRGTAKEAEVAGYEVGGKTGTADKLNANHHYSANSRLSSFIGVFPMNAPKYLVFAMLDDPKGNAKTYGFATGGWVAAPVVNHVVSQIGPLLDLSPLSPDMETAAERQLMKALGSQIVDGMPAEEGSNYASVESDSVQ